jgi:hypothetical protein
LERIKQKWWRFVVKILSWILYGETEDNNKKPVRMSGCWLDLNVMPPECESGALTFCFLSHCMTGRRRGRYYTTNIVREN